MNEAPAISSFPVPYPAIAHLMQKRMVTLFLGAASSLVDASPLHLPDGLQFANDLDEARELPRQKHRPAD